VNRCEHGRKFARRIENRDSTDCDKRMYNQYREHRSNNYCDTINQSINHVYLSTQTQYNKINRAARPL